ncbi:MAG: sigma-70 family RNA polymerase sigma factor [Anaerolineae bacterium]|nr:sigma-70 family RNA polymerase sigma factor [Anaerolineae bacterium]
MTPSVIAEPDTAQTSAVEPQNEERAWAALAQAGDQTAFLNIVDAYQRPIYNLCYRMLDNAAEAEDATQETFLRAYTKINSYQTSRKFSSWLFSIASHYCIDRLRRRRHQTVSWDELPPWRVTPDNAPQPEQVAETREAEHQLRTVIEDLAPDYRAAIILRYWHEMSYDEIAETLDTSVSAIKSRLFRAKQMMGQKLATIEAMTPT